MPEVRQPVEGGDHVGEHSGVEARVDLGGAGEQYVLAEATGENIDGGEVPCGSPVEQGEELVARELFRGSRKPLLAGRAKNILATSS